MARKLPKKPIDPAVASAAQELEVLHPERHLTLGGRAVVVREYGGVEWLRLQAKAAPLANALAAMIGAGQVPGYSTVLDAVADNVDAILPLVAQACDLAPEDLEAFTPDEIDALLMAWWGVNGRFFIQRAVSLCAVERAERQQLAGASSTPPSSPTAMPAPTSGE